MTEGHCTVFRIRAKVCLKVLNQADKPHRRDSHRETDQ